MTIANPRFIGDEVKAQIALARVAGTVGSNTGSAIDRLAATNGGIPLSATLLVLKEATINTPSTQTLDVKITHCDTSGGSYTDYTDPSTGAVAAITQDTSAAAGGIELANVDLSKAKQYLKVVATTAFSGGSSPATPHSVAIILGGYTVTPN